MKEIKRDTLSVSDLQDTNPLQSREGSLPEPFENQVLRQCISVSKFSRKGLHYSELWIPVPVN